MSGAVQFPIFRDALTGPEAAAPGTFPDRPAVMPADHHSEPQPHQLPSVAELETEFNRQWEAICSRVDRLFVGLMLLQWVAAIGMALWVSPVAWVGDRSFLHPHVTLAIFYGGAVTILPVLLAWFSPGKRSTRLTIAITQMMMSSLLIHLNGGRIETHFHIFGSLAFLAFYMDWQVLVVASVTIAIDHFLRGLYLPYSIFGSYAVHPLRWLEHAGWVVFSDIFLLFGSHERRKNLRKLTVRHIEREQLLHHALYDSLTGLPNRSYLLEKMAESIRNSGAAGDDEGFCCIYVDLDRFKEINDKQGHLAGDALLLEVTARIQSHLCEHTFFARLGGDEFIVLAPRDPSEPRRIEEIARNILDSLREPFQSRGSAVIIRASIGISSYPEDGEDPAQLLSRSDQAMYQAKHSGRNGFLFYSSKMEEKKLEAEMEERQLLRAIEQQEFHVQYQPILDVDGAVAGFEALLRWTDPVRGPIPPSRFIPLAENAGLVSQLGSFVLHEACRRATDWHSRGLLDGRIAVNVSSLELANPGFADNVMLTLRQHYTPPEAIELEVTETALVNDFSLAESHLRELHRFGIMVSIDDFGTGYSSLGRLRQLTLDTLKIDRCFIERVATSSADRTVVGHIIAMAHTLGLRVVAEGVETEAQLEALRSLHCDQIQGYLLGRPMSMEKAEEFLTQRMVLTTGAFSAQFAAETHLPAAPTLGAGL